MSTIDVRWWAVLASLLLSLLHALLNPMPNVDAFTYVRTAEVFLSDGLAAAYAWYPSATYPVLIALLHKVTGVDLFVAGQMVNSLFYALLTCTFISLVLEIRDTRRLAVIAAVVVLIYPQLNEYRYFLIRDIASIGFVLLGLLHLVRYQRGSHARNLWWFCLASLVAALFRPESLLYLVAGPLALLFYPEWARRRRWVALAKAEAVVVAVLLTGLGLLQLLGLDIIAVLERAASVYAPFLADAGASLDGESSPISTAVFGEYAADFSGQYIALFLLTGLSAILVLKLITGFGIQPLLVLIYGQRTRSWEISHPSMRAPLWYAGLAFVVMLGFLLLTRFLSTRYTLLFCTLLVLMVPFVIDYVIDRLQAGQWSRTTRSALGFLLLFCVVDAHISFAASKASVEQASDWLRANTEPDARVLTNSSYLAYHSRRVEEYDKVERYIDAETIQNASYDTLLALSLDRGVDELLAHSIEFQQVEFVQSFPPGEEPEFVIYRRLGN